MTKYKIIATENISLNTLDERLSSGEKILIDEPTDSQLSEARRLDSLGMIRLTELEKKTIRTVEEERDEPEEEEDVSDDEDEVDFEEYECPECERTHYVDSQIGKEHLEMYLDNLDEK